MENHTPLLSVVGLDARYSDLPVHTPLDFELEPGGALFLRGPNGVGKTTALLGLAGATPSAAGRVTLNGEKLPPQVALRCAAGRFALVLQRQPVFAELSGGEHFALAAELGGSDPRCVSEVPLFEPLQSKGLLARPAGTCSGGEQRLISLASAWLRRPKVLLLDEPMAGLRADLRPALRAWLERFRREGGALVLVEHDSDFRLEGASELQLGKVEGA